MADDVEGTVVVVGRDCVRRGCGRRAFVVWKTEIRENIENRENGEKEETNENIKQ